jgi:hypothetical protein
MGKVIAFFSKWASAIVLGVVAIALLFALGCTIYTAIKNPFVGIVGTIGVAIALACVIGWISTEIRDIKYFGI